MPVSVPAPCFVYRQWPGRKAERVWAVLGDLVPSQSLSLAACPLLTSGTFMLVQREDTASAIGKACSQNSKHHRPLGSIQDLSVRLD